jgi:hypothetical protein
MWIYLLIINIIAVHVCFLVLIFLLIKIITDDNHDYMIREVHEFYIHLLKRMIRKK